MTPLQSVALLLSFTAFGGYLNRRWLKLPTVLGMTASSVGFSLLLIGVNKIGLIHIDKITSLIKVFNFQQLVLHGLLALLLFSGALFVNASALKKWAFPIGSLATVGVVVSALVTGGLLWFLCNIIHHPIPLVMAFLFGALISPTDPIAALAIVKKIGAPKSLEIKLVGESLFNDGSGVLLFLLLLGFAQGQSLDVTDVLAEVIWQPLVAIVLGYVLGWIAVKALSKIDDYAIEILITLALATGSYGLAEFLNASAPIATVIAGLVIGNKARITDIMSEKTREHLDTFWETIDEIINAALFALMGLELILLDAGVFEIGMGVIAWLSVLIGRWVGVKISLKYFKKSQGTQQVLTWGGLRGGISLALVLTIPATLEPKLLVVMTFVVVVLSALGQGLTLGKVVQYFTKDSNENVQDNSVSNSLFDKTDKNNLF